MKNIAETTNEGTEASKIAGALSVFIGVLLLALVVGVLIWYVFGVAFFKVLAVSLALATLFSLIQVLEVGWFETPLLVMILGLIVAVPVGLLFGSFSFFTVFYVFLAFAIAIPFLMGEKGREEVRRNWRKRRENREWEEQRQQEAKLREDEQERLRQEQEKRRYRPGRQDGGDGGHIVPVLPHELRAMPYEEYLQTPHWKRKRENKLCTVGRRCQVCSRSSGPFHIHHNSYDRLGEELDETSPSYAVDATTSSTNTVA